MKKNSLLKFLLASVLLAACGDSKSDSFPSPEELSDALLTVTEMPDKWNESQRQFFDVREAENPSLDPSVWCKEAQEESANLVTLAGQSGADVEMQAVTDSGMPRLMRLQAWANSDVEEYFDAIEKSVAACDGVTTTNENGPISLFERISGRNIGDESISWSEKVTPPVGTQDEKFETVGRTTVARFGSIIMVLQLGDAAMTGNTEGIDEDAWWSIVQLAGKKLNDL